MITEKLITLNKIREQLENLHQESATGQLIFKTTKLIGRIHLYSGRLLYVTNEIHRVRQWYRATEKYSSKLNMDREELNQDGLWEYSILYGAISKKQLSLTQIKEIIREVAQQCLFEASGYKNLKIEWNPQSKKNSALSLVLTLSFHEINLAITKVAQMRKEWMKAGLGMLQPMLAPVLKPDSNPEKLPVSQEYLDGKNTLWDVALKEKKSLVEVTRSLLPFYGKGLLKFREVADLDIPTSKKLSSQTPTTTPVAKATVPKGKKPLIACIDDSPVVAHNLKKTLEPMGYNILSIKEPMQGFSQLIENKPDLILLDINMPNANGYSVCQFLRSSPVFEKTPIIILTGQDTVIDRARAKLVGATDFIGKPAPKSELLQTIEQYLTKEE